MTLCSNDQKPKPRGKVRKSFTLGRIVFSIASVVVAGGCSPNPSPAPVSPAFNVQVGTNIDLNAYRASLPTPPRTSGHTHARLGAGCGNCWTNVSIQAYSWAKNYGAAHFPTNPGDMYPLGHIVNMGPVTTDMYSLKTNAYAEYDIYVTNDAGAAAWEIIEVPNAPFGRLTVRSKGKLHSCGHTPKSSSEADFRNCDYSATKSAIQLAGASGLEELVARLLSRKPNAVTVGEDPGWISCTEGCCILTVS
jgi:hypothetical protein